MEQNSLKMPPGPLANKDFPAIRLFVSFFGWLSGGSVATPTATAAANTKPKQTEQKTKKKIQMTATNKTKLKTKHKKTKTGKMGLFLALDNQKRNADTSSHDSPPLQQKIEAAWRKMWILSSFLAESALSAISRGYVDHKLKFLNFPQKFLEILFGGDWGWKLMIYTFGAKTPISAELGNM